MLLLRLLDSPDIAEHLLKTELLARSTEPLCCLTPLSRLCELCTEHGVPFVKQGRCVVILRVELKGLQCLQSYRISQDLMLCHALLACQLILSLLLRLQELASLCLVLYVCLVEESDRQAEHHREDFKELVEGDDSSRVRHGVQGPSCLPDDLLEFFLLCRL